jgi:hypothetical protein
MPPVSPPRFTVAAATATTARTAPITLEARRFRRSLFAIAINYCQGDGVVAHTPKFVAASIAPGSKYLQPIDMPLLTTGVT